MSCAGSVHCLRSDMIFTVAGKFLIFSFPNALAVRFQSTTKYTNAMLWICFIISWSLPWSTETLLLIIVECVAAGIVPLPSVLLTWDCLDFVRLGVALGDVHNSGGARTNLCVGSRLRRDEVLLQF